MYVPFDFELKHLYSFFQDDATCSPTVYLSSSESSEHRRFSNPGQNGIGSLKSETFRELFSASPTPLSHSSSLCGYRYQSNRRLFTTATKTGDAPISAWFALPLNIILGFGS